MLKVMEKSQPCQKVHLVACGNGSIILHAIVGTIAGGLVLIKLYLYRIKNFFKKQTPEEPPDGENN